jgi:hypothetical protein
MSGRSCVRFINILASILIVLPVLPAYADQDDRIDIDIDYSSSTLQHNVTPAELYGDTSGTDFRIRGDVEISNSLKYRNVYFYLSTTVLPLTRGSTKANVLLTGTIGSTPVSILPGRINFANRQAQIDIIGQIMPGQLNPYMPPGTYSGTLVITAFAL